MQKLRPERVALDRFPPFVALKMWLGSNLRRLRNRLGLTQEAVAAKAEMPIRLYQDLEAGKSNATLLTLARVSSAIEAPPSVPT